MRSFFLTALTIAAAFTFCTLSAQKQNAGSTTLIRELPLETPYVEPVMGLVFPARNAGFLKCSVIENANPVYGTVVRYAGPAGATADIYIYSLDTGSSPVTAEMLVQQYEETKKRLLAPVPPADYTKKNVPGALPVPENVKLLKETVFRDNSGILVYRASFECQIGDESYVSDLVMLRAERKVRKMVPEASAGNAKLVKIRLTRPSDVVNGSGNSETLIENLCKSILGCVKIGFEPLGRK